MIRIMFIILLSFLVFGSTVFAQQENANTSADIQSVKIAGTQLLKLHSSTTGRDYELYVNLPRFYNDTTKTFPVIYCLDAQWDFPLVQSIFGEQYYDGFVPGAVIVGITWGGINPNYDSLRAKDLTPGPNSAQYGNASNFLKCIKDEIIPFIESKYRVKKDDRTLMGSSFGGLFTLYTLFTETKLFNRYILTSPALTWDNGIIYKYEKDYAENNSKLSARVYMAVGGYEDVNTFQKFADIIKNQNFEGLKFQTKVVDGMGHSGGKAEGYSRGMQFVFERPSINVDPKILNQYAGEYQLSPDVNVKLAVENNQLVAYVPGDIKIILNAESDKDFYVIGSYGFVHFQKDDSGKVTGFEMEQYTGKMFIKKIAE